MQDILSLGQSLMGGLGLIASVGTGGNEEDIELVKNLVSSYIKKSTCIILLTVACESMLS